MSERVAPLCHGKTRPTPNTLATSASLLQARGCWRCSRRRDAAAKCSAAGAQTFWSNSSAKSSCCRCRGPVTSWARRGCCGRRSDAPRPPGPRRFDPRMIARFMTGSWRPRPYFSDPTWANAAGMDGAVPARDALISGTPILAWRISSPVAPHSCQPRTGVYGRRCAWNRETFAR